MDPLQRQAAGNQVGGDGAGFGRQRDGRDVGGVGGQLHEHAGQRDVTGVFEHRVFVPHPYAIIDLDVMKLAGKTTLFGACRLSDMKMGQVVTFELASDQAKFERLFTPD